jgi:hypothetical protein
MTSSKNRLLSAAVIILFQTLTTPLVVVGAVDGDITSIPSTEWSNFETSLSDAASLHGPLQDFSYVASCEILGTNAYLISDSANGLCMQAHDCAREFCSSDEEFDLPSYVVEVKTEMDVAMVRRTLYYRHHLVKNCCCLGRVFHLFCYSSIHSFTSLHSYFLFVLFL